jgi:salicylate hydroxylase
MADIEAGIGSTIRSMVFPDDSFQPRKTPDCAVRVILSKSAMERDPQLARMAKTPGADIWLGPRRHVITYNIRGMELLNVVICGPGSASVGVWNEPANLEDVKREYADFEPTIRSILNCADDCHKWMIAEVPDLPGWSSPSGKVVLLGDAAHAMMPYAAQVSPLHTFVHREAKF